MMDSEIVWCCMSEAIVEIVRRPGRSPICFAPEPFARCDMGNTCGEPDWNFVELSECELRVGVFELL